MYRVASPSGPSTEAPPTSPPNQMAPIAEAETSDGTYEQSPNYSEELGHAQYVIPPADSMLEVRAEPAEAIGTPPEPAETRRIVFPITPFYRRKKDGCPSCTVWLGLLCVLFFLLSIALFLVWAITSNGFRNLGGSGAKVCSTKDCTTTAYRMSSYMDDTIEPCDNFYRFSCNKFHQMNEDQRRNFLDVLKENTDRAVYGLLSKKPDTGSRTERLAKSLFKSCMDATQRSKLGGYPLLDLLRNLPCGPIFSECRDFNPDYYNWERHSGSLDWYAGSLNLVNYARDVDPTDRSKMILQLRPANLEPLFRPVREQLIQLTNPSAPEIDPLLQLALRQNVLNDMVSRQLMRDPKEVEGDLDEVALFMIEVNRISRNSVSITNSMLPQLQNVTYITLSELFRLAPNINFADMFSAQLSSLTKWTEADTVSVQDLDYFVQLSDLVKRSSKRAIANYLQSVTVINLRQYSFDPKIQYSWRDCVRQLSALEPVEKLYITQHKNFTGEKIRAYLQTLKLDFINTHRQYPLQYLTEVNRLAFLAGYPKRKTNDDAVWKPFSEMKMNESNYFASAVLSWKSQRNFELSLIGTHLDRDDAPEYPVLASTIVYNPQLVTMILPLSFLQEPMTLPGQNVPWYTVYGSFAVVVQQMISKIFWLKMDQKAPKICFDNIYRSFLDSNYQNNLDISSDLSYTIELADAVRSASYGYTKWQTENKEFDEKSLPAFEQYDNYQTMLMDFGTLFCNTEGSQSGSQYEAMINTVMSNSRLFTVHFQCTNGTSVFNRRMCI